MEAVHGCPLALIHFCTDLTAAGLHCHGLRHIFPSMALALGFQEVSITVYSYESLCPRRVFGPRGPKTRGGTLVLSA